MKSLVSFRYTALAVTLMVILALLVVSTGCTQQSKATTTTPTATATTAPSVVATTAAATGLANPASVACNQSGGIVVIKTDANGGQYGMCTFANGTSCEEWALFRGEGCQPGVITSNATTAPTTSRTMTTFTDKDANSTVNVPVATKFAVSLAENPTTGFQWNATVTPGLTIVSDSYAQTAGTEKLVGAGGTRTWVLQGNETGAQKFSAVYKRSWEATTGNETSYSLNINIVKA